MPTIMEETKNELVMPELQRSINILGNMTPVESLGDDPNGWHLEIEENLKKISVNCSQQCEICKKNYIELLEQQKYFSIPIIVISGLNSIFAVGLNSYMGQSSVSVINCILSFFVSVVQSIGLYLNIAKRIEINMTSYRNFYLLSLKINNILSLKRSQREENDGHRFLDECIAEYEGIFTTMNITKDPIDDKLIEINELKIDLKTTI